MSVELIARAWERPVDTKGCRRSGYSASWTSIVSMLRGELRNLNAKNVIVEMAIEPSDVRDKDQWIRSTARPRSPGVRLSFTGKYGPLVYECGTWSGWEHNVYAVARTLRAQRMIARDGAVKGDQVYRGFKALPGQGGNAPIQAGPFATTEDAARHLLTEASHPTDEHHVRLVIEGNAMLNQVFRRASQRAHPDMAGGSNERMARVNAAKDMIEAGQLAAA